MTKSKIYPPVVIVDENDKEIGSSPLEEVWKQGLYHRVVSIFVEDEHGNTLLQLRNPQVKIDPSCWDQAAGGHVDEGDSYEQTAVRELAEETGLHNLKLKMLGTFRTNEKLDDGRIINRFERVYVTHVRHDVELQPELEEMTKLRWFSPAELSDQIAKNRESFTEGLCYALEQYFPR